MHTEEDRNEFINGLLKAAADDLQPQYTLAIAVLDLVRTGDFSQEAYDDLCAYEWDEEKRAREIHEFDMQTAGYPA